MVACCLSLLVTAIAFAAARKGILFWNLTGETLTDVSLAPAGTDHFGPNQCSTTRTARSISMSNLPLAVVPGRYDLPMKERGYDPQKGMLGRNPRNES